MKRRWLLGGAGCLLMGYAVLGALADPDVNPPGHLAFLAAVLVGHDAVLMPLAIGVGVLLGRFAGRVRTVLQAALFVSAVITFITLPLVLGPGRGPRQPWRSDDSGVRLRPPAEVRQDASFSAWSIANASSANV